MTNGDSYTYKITYDARDGVFVARVAEFKSLTAHGDTHEAALNEIRYILEDVLLDLQESGEPIPEPLAEKEYSGKFVLRLPKSLHRHLAERAQEEGVSLNQLVVSQLART